MCHANLGVVGLATNFTGEILLLLLLQMAAVYVLHNCGPILPYLLSFYLHIIIFLNLFGHPVWSPPFRVDERVWMLVLSLKPSLTWLIVTRITLCV